MSVIKEIRTVQVKHWLKRRNDLGVYNTLLRELRMEDEGEHCVKSVQIQSYFWSVFSCIQSGSRKIRSRNNSVFRHFSRSGM